MSARSSFCLVIEVVLGLTGIGYAYVAAMLLLLSPLLAGADIRDHARRLGWPVWLTWLVGSLCWPVLAWRQWRRA